MVYIDAEDIKCVISQTDTSHPQRQMDVSCTTEHQLASDILGGNESCSLGANGIASYYSMYNNNSATLRSQLIDLQYPS